MTASGVYKHNKTGKTYFVKGTGIIATNGDQNGKPVVIYQPLDDPNWDPNKYYVRDEPEFNSPGRFTYCQGPRKEHL